MHHDVIHESVQPIYSASATWPRHLWRTFQPQNGSSVATLSGLWRAAPLACPRLSLHVLVLPLPLLANLLDCGAHPPSLVLQLSAGALLPLSPQGFGAFSFAGVVPLSRLQSPLPLSLRVALAAPSYVSSAVSFLSLVADIDSLLLHASGRPSPSSSSQPSPLAVLPSSSTAAQPDLSRTLWAVSEDADLAGALSVSLRASTFAGALQRLHPSRDLCLPLAWSVVVTPLSPPAPYVARVQPSSALHLPLRRDLVVDLAFAALSGPLMAAQDRGVLVPASAIEVRLAFSLVCGPLLLSPDRVVLDPTSNSVLWRLIFSADSISELIASSLLPSSSSDNNDDDHDEYTFILTLAKDYLFSASGVPVVLFTNNTYNFVDPHCASHGALNAFGECRCDAGYAGPACTACAVGHHAVGGDAACIPDGAPEHCAAGSCWGHGACAESPPGTVVCACDRGYDPPYCRACAPGYSIDPASSACRAPSQCAPATCSAHGACDDSSGFATCTCDLGYAAPDCGQCADGYALDKDGQCAPSSDPPTCEPDTCGGHGVCSVDAFDTVSCRCDQGFDGPRCASCALHFVEASPPPLLSCVPSVPCPPSGACSSHGRCDDSSGVAACTCDSPSLALPDCASCAAGRVDYPACTLPVAPRKPCDVPLLPSLLDPLMLDAGDGEAHLQGGYYLDPLERVHDIGFSLRETSLLRAYVEPYFVDIDLYLYEVLADGSLSLLQLSIAASTEEDVLALLEVPAGAQRAFRLRLSFLLFTAPQLASSSLDALCLAFNFELALSPARRVQALEAAYQQRDPCVADLLPPAALFPPVVSQALSQTVPVAHLLSSAALPADQPHYFWSWQFNVSSAFSQPGHFVLLSAELGFRFLPGQISLLLEASPFNSDPILSNKRISSSSSNSLFTSSSTSSTSSSTSSTSSSSTIQHTINAPLHCGNGEMGGTASRCLAGRNLRNRQILSAALVPGAYTLWLYEPSPQLSAVSPCAHFDLSLSLSLSPLPSPLFTCPLPPLPASLALPSLALPDGSLRLADAFLLPSAHSLSFTVASPGLAFGLLSAIDDLQGVSGTFSLFSTSSSSSSSSTSQPLASASLGARMALPLPLGDYRLDFSLQLLDGTQAAALDCQPLRLDLRLSALQDLAAFVCPSSPVLPQLQPASDPYAAPASLPASAYVAFPPSSPSSRGSTLLVSSFAVAASDSPAFLRVLVDHRFFSPFAIQLRAAPSSSSSSTSSSGTLVASSFVRQDQAVLEAVLQPSAAPYTVNVLWQQQRAVPLPCAPFTLAFTLTSLSSSSSSPSSSPAPNACLRAESLPSSLDSPRFRDFSADDAFSFASAALLLPTDLPSSLPVSLSAAVPSVFRLSVDTHGLADCMIGLFFIPSSSTDAPVFIASSSYSASSGQSILLAQLNASSSYLVALAFSSARPSLPPCATFSLRAALRPSAAFLPQAPPCAPALPPAAVPPQGLDLPSLAFLRGASPLALALSFSRDAPFDLHAEAYSDFLSADLALLLTASPAAPSALPAAFPGQSHASCASLSLADLPPGNYSLLLYEPAPFLPVLPGCSPFSLAVFFAAGSSALRLADSPLAIAPYALPADLGRLPFLGYAGAVSVTDDYRLPTAAPSPLSIPLRGVPSLLQLTAVPLDPLFDTSFSLYLASENDATSSLVATSEQHYNYFHGAALVYAIPEDDSNAAANFTLQVSLSPRASTRSISSSTSSSITPAYSSVTLSMSILPLSVYHNLVAATDALVGAPACASSPDVLLPVDPEGFALFSRSGLLLSASAARHRVRFTAAAPSRLFAQLQFPFPLASLVLSLAADASPEPLAVPHGNEGLLELNVALPAGTYYLDTRRFAAAPHAPACLPFSLQLTLSPLSAAAPGAQCAAYAVMPWDLNAELGGSAQFGGPLRDGRLNLYGDGFYLHAAASQALSFPIAMALNASALVSVFTRASPRLLSQTASLRGPFPAAPLIAPAFERQGASLFRFFRPDQPVSQLLIEVRASSSAQSAPCPAMALHVFTQSLAQVAQMLLCPAAVAPMPLSAIPPIAVSRRGFYDYALNGVAPLNATAVRSQIAVPSGAILSLRAAVSFNSLVGFFEMSLLSRSSGATLASAALDAVPNRGSAALDMIASLSTLLVGSTPLELVIAFTPFLPADDALCVPFDLTIQITPRYTAIPFVQSVVPSSARYLSSQDTLELSLIFSSSPLTDQHAQPLTSLTVLPCFALVPLPPHNQSALALSPRSAAGYDRSWTLYWPRLSPDFTYQLALADDCVFFNATAATLTTTHQYHAIDDACHQNGQLNRFGYCDCDAGYASAECDLCAVGYHEASTPTASFCLPSGCALDSCGCKSAARDEACEPLGTCLGLEEGVLTCACPSGVDPSTHCASCLPGFSNYPSCNIATSSSTLPSSTHSTSSIPITRSSTTGSVSTIGTTTATTTAPTTSSFSSTTTVAPCDLACLHGFCEISKTSQPHCACDDGWMGLLCDAADNCTASCQHGTCQSNPTNGLLECICDDGYTGRSCADLDKTFGTAWMITGIVLASLVLAVGIGILIAYFVRKSKSQTQAYQPVLDLDDISSSESDIDDTPDLPSKEPELRFDSSTSDDDSELHFNIPEPRILNLPQDRRESILDQSDDDLFNFNDF